MNKQQIIGLTVLLFIAVGTAFLVKPTAAPPVIEGTVLGEWDFNHDGAAETVALAGDGKDLQSSVSWELRVLDEAGDILWSDSAVLSHAGWNTIAVCEVDGQAYLLRYQPTMYQGIGSYVYRLFSLDAFGGEAVLAENALEFNMNFGNPYQEENFDPVTIAAFLEEIHGYLDQSTILLSTENMEFRSGVSGKELRSDVTVFWDQLHPYDESKSLLKNLQALKE